LLLSRSNQIAELGLTRNRWIFNAFSRFILGRPVGADRRYFRLVQKSISASRTYSFKFIQIVSYLSNFEIILLSFLSVFL